MGHLFESGAGAGITRVVAAAALAGFFGVLLTSLAHFDDVPLLVTGLLAGFVVVSAWKPETGSLILAALVPNAAWLGAGLDGAIVWPEVLVVAFCAGYAARLVLRPSEPADDLDVPVLVMGAIVVASLVVELAIMRARLGIELFARDFRQILTEVYYIGNSGLPALDAAMRLVEGLVLFRAAARTAQQRPAFAARLVRWLVAGAASAATLNIVRLQAAHRQAPDAGFTTFLEYLAVQRVNVHHMDLTPRGRTS